MDATLLYGVDSVVYASAASLMSSHGVPLKCNDGTLFLLVLLAFFSWMWDLPMVFWTCSVHHVIAASQICPALASTWKPEDTVWPYCWCVSDWVTEQSSGAGSNNFKYQKNFCTGWIQLASIFCLLFGNGAFWSLYIHLGLPCIMVDNFSWIIIWIRHACRRITKLARFSGLQCLMRSNMAG